MSGMAAALAESLQLKRTFFAAHGEAIAAQARRLAAALKAGGKLLAFGNGGSAADARRAAACLLENGFPAVPLASFAGNPLSFAELYRALRRPGDCAMAISTSGNSANVLDAVRAARGLGDPVIALTGKGGGHLLGLVPDALVVPSASTQRIQEVHIMIVHELCALAIAECGMRNAE
jgi:D-sedoheptulose 7-phosphate isomerase